MIALTIISDLTLCKPQLYQLAKPSLFLAHPIFLIRVHMVIRPPRLQATNIYCAVRVKFVIILAEKLNKKEIVTLLQ